MSDWHKTFQLFLSNSHMLGLDKCVFFFLFFPVCRDFAVLEDHCLAHNLQEQESKGPFVLFLRKSPHFHSAFFLFFCISITYSGQQRQSLSSVQHLFFFWWCLPAFQRRLALCLLCQRRNIKAWLEEKKNTVPFPLPPSAKYVKCCVRSCSLVRPAETPFQPQHGIVSGAGC